MKQSHVCPNKNQNAVQNYKNHNHCYQFPFNLYILYNRNYVIANLVLIFWDNNLK